MNEMSAPRAAERRPSLVILVTISTVSPLALNIYLPSMPSLVGLFDTTMARVQLTLSLYLAAFALAQIVIGPLSDRYGRRPVLLWGMVVFMLGSLACALAPDIDFLIAGRILQAAGGSTGIVLGRAIVRDLYDRRQAASMIGYVTMGLAVAPMVGPAIGGVLDHVFGWTASFYLMVLIGLVVLVVSWFDLHETNLQPSSAGLVGLLRGFGALARVPAFWAYALTSSFASSVFFTFLGGAPFVSVELLAMAPAVYGFYFMMVAGGYIIGNWISGRFAVRIGVRRMILAGTVLQAISVLLIGLAFAVIQAHPLSLFAPMFLVGIANGTCLPSAIAGAVSVRPELAGAASGLSGSLQIGTGAVSSALVGWLLSGVLWPGTIWPLILVMGVCVVLSIVFAGMTWAVDEGR